MDKKQATTRADSESVHLDPDSSLDLPGSSDNSSPTAPSILGFSSPLASISTPDSSFLGPSSSFTRKAPQGITGRWSNESALGRLVNDDWKAQTEEQRRRLQETPSKSVDHGEHYRPYSFNYHHPSTDLYQDQRDRSIKRSSHDLFGASSNEEAKFDFEPLPAPTPTNNSTAGLLESLRAMTVNDYTGFSNPRSYGSGHGSMAYLSPHREANPSPGLSAGTNAWNGPNDKNPSHSVAGATESRSLWSWHPTCNPLYQPRSAFTRTSQHQTTNTFPIPSGTSTGMSTSTWAPTARPTNTLFLPSNQLIQQQQPLGPPAFPPVRPLPQLPPTHPTSDSVFHPMESRPLDKNVTGVAAMDLMVKGFSPNYRGNPDLERNRSAPIPPDRNCSLFITGLAPNLTTTQLLATIRDVGRVYATHINFPEPDRGHFTCAAKVVFFERSAAERFYERYGMTGFRVTGDGSMHVGRVVWNRIRSAEQDVGGRKTRVLLISGPPSIVSEKALKAYFNTKIQYQVDDVRTLRTYAADGGGGDGGGEERALVEFRFGSYRCQSEAARMALSREFKEFGVFCDFGQDPCDLASKFGDGKENIDNDPAFALENSQADVYTDSFESPSVAARNWFYN